MAEKLARTEQYHGTVISQPELGRSLSALTLDIRTALEKTFSDSPEIERLRFDEMLSHHADVLAAMGNSDVSVLLTCKELNDDYWKKPLGERITHHMLLDAIHRETKPRGLSPTARVERRP